MKTTLSVLVAVLALATNTSTLAADQATEQSADNYTSRASAKFGTGILNAATGLAEIPKNMYLMSNQEGLAVGLPVGFFKGLFHTLGRVGVGAMEMATFYIPTKPMLNAPLVWENFDKETTYGTNWELYNTR